MANAHSKTVQKPIRFHRDQWRAIERAARLVARERRAVVTPSGLFREFGMEGIMALLSRLDAPRSAAA